MTLSRTFSPFFLSLPAYRTLGDGSPQCWIVEVNVLPGVECVTRCDRQNCNCEYYEFHFSRVSALILFQVLEV